MLTGQQRHHPRLRRALWAALAGLVVAAIAAGCGSPARSVSLASLVADQQTYQGQVVTTEGVVQRFGPTTKPYFVIADAADNRVEVTPASSIARYAGRRVRVTGRFDFVAGTGRVIEAQRVSGI